MRSRSIAALGFMTLVACSPASDPIGSRLHPPDEAMMGASYGRTRRCASCHDPGDGSMSGQTAPLAGTQAYGTNLTPDTETGIGAWSDDEIARALTDGVDDQMDPLCPSMPRYADMSDAESGAIVAWLRALRPVRREIPPSSCPPIKGGDDGTGDDPGSDSGANVDGGVPIDAAVSAPDLARPDAAAALADLAPAGATPDLATPDLATPDLATPTVAGCHLLINELQVAGAAGSSDEFVEVLNPCGSDAILDGVRLVYRSAAGTRDDRLLTLSGTLATGGYWVCGGPRFSGHADATYKVGGLADEGGGVALRDASGVILDSVGYGTATNAFVRGHVAPAPPKSQSIARIPDGRDTIDNARDFTITATPTPGAPNR